MALDTEGVLLRPIVRHLERATFGVRIQGFSTDYADFHGAMNTFMGRIFPRITRILTDNKRRVYSDLS